MDGETRMTVTVKGLNTVTKNINLYFKKEEKEIVSAVVGWARRTRNDSIKMAPSDTGNLRRTSFFDYSRTKNYISARVGFTAKYAASVHEILNPSAGIERKSGSKKGYYWDTGQPKFLEIPARRNLRILEKNLRGR